MLWAGAAFVAVVYYRVRPFRTEQRNKLMVRIACFEAASYFLLYFLLPGVPSGLARAVAALLVAADGALTLLFMALYALVAAEFFKRRSAAKAAEAGANARDVDRRSPAPQGVETVAAALAQHTDAAERGDAAHVDAAGHRVSTNPLFNPARRESHPRAPHGGGDGDGGASLPAHVRAARGYGARPAV